MRCWGSWLRAVWHELAHIRQGSHTATTGVLVFLVVAASGAAGAPAMWIHTAVTSDTTRASLLITARPSPLGSSVDD